MRAVVFDWGGTLTQPLEPLLYRRDVWAEAAARLLPDRKEEIVQGLLDAEAHLWELSRTVHKSSRLTDLFMVAAERVGVTIADMVLEEASAHHLETHAPNIAHDEDALDVLTELRDRGIKTALLSNTFWPGSFHDRLLERDGLRDLLDARLYTSEMELTKPHPEVFAAALDAVGVDEPGSAVFVGDRPWDDIYGAQKAGLRTVLRPNPSVPPHDVEPDATIESLPSLLDVVDRWCR